MRFLIHIPQLIYGGAEKVLVDFANYLVSEGHDVEILETYERGLLKNEFNNKIKFNSICSKDFTRKYYVSLDEIRKENRVSQKIKKIFKKIFITVVGYERLAHLLATKRYRTQKYDVAINYLETQSPFFCLNSIHADKYFQWIHIDINQIEDIKFIDKQISLYERMDSIICVSNVARDSFINRYKNLKNKTYVLYNFYNPSKIIDLSNQYEVEMNHETINFISIGRLVEQKGYKRTIAVFNHLKSEGYNFNWYIIGDGILREELQIQIDDLDLSDNIYLIGVKENPYPYIKNGDLFLLCSLYEGFPTVTIEAKILNKPVIATDVCGIREQLNHNISGYIIDNNDVSLYNGLKLFLDNPNLKDNLCANRDMDSIFKNEFKYSSFMNLIKKID